MEARLGFDREDGSCLACDGHAVKRKSQYGEFHGCSNYPTCRNSEAIRAGRGSFLLSGDDIDRAYYDAFYDGDGKN